MPHLNAKLERATPCLAPPHPGSTYFLRPTSYWLLATGYFPRIFIPPQALLATASARAETGDSDRGGEVAAAAAHAMSKEVAKVSQPVGR